MEPRVPMPGDTDVVAGTIIASCHYGDDDPQEFWVIVLNEDPPHYTVARIVEEVENGEGVGVWTFLEAIDAENIVSAARRYQEESGAE